MRKFITFLTITIFINAYCQDYKNALFLTLDNDCIIDRYTCSSDTLDIETYSVRLSPNAKWGNNICLDEHNQLLKNSFLITPFASLSATIYFRNEKKTNSPFVVKSYEIRNRLSCEEILNSDEHSDSAKWILDHFEKIFLLYLNKESNEYEAKLVTYKFNPRL
jgi:hypothetical protein